MRVWALLTVALALSESPAGDFPVGCEESDYERYKVIVCNDTVQKCANHCEDTQVCGRNVEWCKKFVSTMTQKFGSCKEKGCPASS